MRFPSGEFDDAVAALCDGAILDDALGELQALLADDAAARDEYLWRVELHARLATWDVEVDVPAESERELAFRNAPGPIFSPIRLTITTLAIVAAVLLGVVFWQATWPASPGHGPAQAQPVVARIVAINAVRWVDANARHQADDELRAGQALELSSGSVVLRFDCGASVSLVGPAIFAVDSQRDGRLSLGQAQVTAATPESKGFTLHTRTARVIDLGTEFTAEASVDGHCRVGVLSGEVQVLLAASDAPHHLRAGETMEVEPGAEQVLVRIEPGDDTAAFRFHSIEPPSDADYADLRQGHARITVEAGQLATGNATHPNTGSGPVETLLDGKGQTSRDAPQESVFFHRVDTGRLLLDLGSSVSVSKINTYSWHQNGRDVDNRLRAQQQYLLYGFDGDTPPPLDSDSAVGDPVSAGWSLIARVSTDEHFGVMSRMDRPGQQACSITSTKGTLGRYRYLLWEVQPSRLPDYKFLNHTFFGEFDVYAKP